MKRGLSLSIALSFFLLFIPISSDATLIGFEPASQDVPVGDIAQVDLVISGLDLFLPDSLSTFDLDISFDETILALDSVAFGDPVLGDQLDLFGFGSITAFDDSISGIVNLFELSLDLPDALNMFQWESFTLATLTFDTLAVGTSSLDIAINALGDAWGDPLELEADPVSGNISPVPEPATILLIGTGLVGLGYLKRKKRIRS